jgi:hypothetical protein
MWDALDSAITALEPEAGRRAVVLMTDGKSTGNHKSLGEVADRAIHLNIPVSTVAVGLGMFHLRQAEDRLARIQPTLALENLSAATGGLAVELPQPKPGSPLTRVALALRRAYRLSVETGLNDGRFHRVAIRTRDASHQVRTRAGFKAERLEGTSR